MEYIAIMLGGLLVISIWIISNLYNQITTLERVVKDTDDRMYKVYTFMLELFTRADSELGRIDKRGAFSSDDEVGFTFRIIKESIEQVKYQLLQMDTKFGDDASEDE